MYAVQATDISPKTLTGGVFGRNGSANKHHLSSKRELQTFQSVTRWQGTAKNSADVTQRRYGFEARRKVLR